MSPALRICTLEVGVDLGFDFEDDGQVAVDFGDDSDFARRLAAALRESFRMFPIDNEGCATAFVNPGLSSCQ